MKIKKISLFALAVLFAGLSIAVLIYPVAANFFVDGEHSAVITDYTAAVNSESEQELEEILKTAKEYNVSLFPVRSGDNAPTGKTNYTDVLNINGNGLMGYIEIPKLDIYLPIYHGTAEETLKNGIGHVYGTSVPVGGVGSHTVLTGHSGMAENKLFTDIRSLQKDDVFYLHVLGQTLAYKVIGTNIVEPADVSLLKIDKERDLCTLVTCTPIGVNSHRLLVRAERTEYIPEEYEAAAKTADKGQSTWLKTYALGLAIGVVSVMVFLIATLFIFKRIKKQRGVENGKIQ